MSEVIFYVLPIISVVLSLVVYFNYKLNSMSRKYEDYKNDRYRQSIEKQIYELSKELSVNSDRFNNINHLINDAQSTAIGTKSKYNSERSPAVVNTFLKNLGLNEIPDVDMDQVFVLTPFNDEFQGQFDAIKSVIEESGFKCSRGDDSKQSSNILGHIIEQICRSRVIIANISGRNANVFYELGIAHALNKPVVIVSETLTEIPFDIHSTRILTFTDNDDLKVNLRKWFVQTIASA